ncbi:MAG TPA: acyl carrier protein [Gallicola sp.]|jgi:acyl carrier protein|nr:acyl carrier protein [Gallicola sp.]
MEKEKFLVKFAEQFDETDVSEIMLDTVFKNLEEWSSLTALSIIAMCDEEYSIKVTGEDIRNIETVEDLYKLVNSRK